MSFLLSQRFYFLLIIICCSLGCSRFNTKAVIDVPNPEIPRSEKEALIILPGLGDSKKGRSHQKLYFGSVGYDLYIPDYIDKKSYERTLKNFSDFFNEQQLGEYKKVHVFAYILGTWIINSFIINSGIQNITTIVYDRSPLQELAPRLIVDVIPLLGKIFSGRILDDFSKESYPSILKNELNIGIIVENKATPLIRIFRENLKSYGSIDWENLNFEQSYDDLIYTRLNHDEMYYRFDEIGEDILEFIKTSKFKKDSKRSPFKWDPFEKYSK